MAYKAKNKCKYMGTLRGRENKSKQNENKGMDLKWSQETA